MLPFRQLANIFGILSGLWSAMELFMLMEIPALAFFVPHRSSLLSLNLQLTCDSAMCVVMVGTAFFPVDYFHDAHPFPSLSSSLFANLTISVCFLSKQPAAKRGTMPKSQYNPLVVISQLEYYQGHVFACT